MDDDPYVVIAAFLDATQAHVARGLLESEGIDTLLRDEHLVTANWLWSSALGGVRLMVPASREAQARRLLQQAGRGELALDDTEDVEPMEARGQPDEVPTGIDPGIPRHDES